MPPPLHTHTHTQTTNQATNLASKSVKSARARPEDEGADEGREATHLGMETEYNLNGGFGWLLFGSLDCYNDRVYLYGPCLPLHLYCTRIETVSKC